MSGNHSQIKIGDGSGLGHSRVGFTLDVYSHVLDGMQEEAAAKLDAALRWVVKK